MLKILAQLYNPPYPNITDCDFFESANVLISDYEACLTSSHPLGYCSQPDLAETGITAVFAANFSECMRQLSVKKNRKTTDMIYCHQPQLIASRGFADITCFARFDNDECEALDGSRCLYPLSVIEFTKNATRPICQIHPQASLSAN